MGNRQRPSFSNEHPTIEEISEYYIDSEESLNSYFPHISMNGNFPTKFIGYTVAEVIDELKTRKETLNRMCALETLAAIEARFRIDYINRSKNKLKDPLSRKLRAIYRKKENRASLPDDIISTWKAENPGKKNILDEFSRALDYRNWLAHGRYWIPKKHPHISRFDYLSISILASQVISGLDLVE